MEFRIGKVVGGKIVLEDDEVLEEGALVQVVVGNPDEVVTVTDDELKLIRDGQAAASRGELLDAREFLAALRAVA